jgi:hypothetical protein
MAKAKQTAEKDPMAKNEKHNDGTMSGLKKTIIGTVSTLVVGGGTFLMSYLQKPKESDTKAQPTSQQSININLPAQQQAAGGKTVIIKEKAPADKDVKKAENSEKPKPKKDGDEFKEKPAQW